MRCLLRTEAATVETTCSGMAQYCPMDVLQSMQKPKRPPKTTTTTPRARKKKPAAMETVVGTVVQTTVAAMTAICCTGEKTGVPHPLPKPHWVNNSSSNNNSSNNSDHPLRFLLLDLPRPPLPPLLPYHHPLPPLETLWML